MKEDKTYNKQNKISTLSFISGIPNIIAVSISAIVSGSILTWLDFVDSFGGLLSDVIIMLESRKLSRNLKFEYNYGVGKLEAITTFLCEGIQIGGLLGILFISIMELFDPSKPSDMLIYVVGLKLINILCDLGFVYSQKKLYNQNPTTIAQSQVIAFAGALSFDVATLLSLLVSWLLRNNKVTWYISPILSLLIAIYLLSICVKHIKSAIHELTEKTLPEKEQLKILKVITKLNDKYSSFGSINSKYNGTNVEIDLNVKFNSDTTFEEIQNFKETLQKELEKEIENCRVTLYII